MQSDHALRRLRIRTDKPEPLSPLGGAQQRREQCRFCETGDEESRATTVVCRVCQPERILSRVAEAVAGLYAGGPRPCAIAEIVQRRQVYRDGSRILDRSICEIHLPERSVRLHSVPRCEDKASCAVKAMLAEFLLFQDAESF